MDKRRLHHLWTKIRPIKTWYLLVVFLVLGAVSVFALRQNNLGMIELREAVYEADEKGGDVEGALQQLRQYVYAHMNTELSSGQSGVYPPIQLKYTYQRLQQAEKQRANQGSADIYTEAQRVCEQQNPTGFSGRGRVPCIEEYVSQHKVVEKTIPDALYKFDFVSSSWSPDLAGFSVVLTVLAGVLLVLRIIAGKLLKPWTG
jgi:hypothetical protein